MANNNKHTGPNVPALRFPEFSGEWERKALSEFVDRVTRRNKGLKSTRPLTISAQFGLVDQTEFFKKSVAGADLSNYYLLSKGEFAYNKSYSDGYPLGAIKRLDRYDSGVLSSLYICFVPKPYMSSDYLVQYFESTKWNQVVKDISGEGARNHGLLNVPVTGFFETQHYIPKRDEQEKLGAFLTLIEKRIATQSKIIEELKTLRGALNESLYCCCESYQELSFNDVGVSYSGLSGKSGNDFGSGYPFIPYINIFTNNIIDEGQLEYVQVREDESQNSVCFGDLLMTLSSETPEEVGIGAVYLGHESPMYLNSFAFGIHITRTDLVYPPYLSWLVSTKSFRKFILPYAQGSTRYNLQKTDFMKAKYRFPTLGQQKAISVLLSGYSSKIENEERVLNKYTALKQGLIEQLFI